MKGMRLREERRQTYEHIIHYTIISLIKRAFDDIILSMILIIVCNVGSVR